MLEAKGVRGGILIFDGDNVIIKRQGGALAITGEKKIAIENIVEIEFKQSSWAANGYIRISTSAGQTKVAISYTGEAENAVLFGNKEQKDFIAIKDAIDEARKNIKKPSGGSVSSVADELKKLLELKQLGVLSEKEFEEQKKKLL